MGLERFGHAAGPQNSRDQVFLAVRDMVGAGVGPDAANRFYHFCPTHLVADRRWDAQGIPLAK